MGRMVLIIVILFTIVVSFFFISSNNAIQDSNDLIAKQAYKSEASISAHEVINYTINDYLKNPINVSESKHIVLNEEQWGNTEVTSYIEDTNDDYDYPKDTIKITALANQVSVDEIGADSTYREITAEIELQTGIPSNPLGLFGNNTDIDINTGRISGYNHDLGSNPWNTDDNPKHGIVTNGDAGALREQYRDETWNSMNPIIGAEDNNRDDPSIKEEEKSIDVQKYIDQISNLSGITKIDDNKLSGTFGSKDPNKDEPEIVYCQGNTVLDDTVEGEGILVVEGDLNTTSEYTLNWDGAVIVNDPTQDANGQNNTDVILEGNSEINGTLLAGGTTTDNVNVTAQGEEVEFDIGNDVVTPKEDFRAEVTTIGSELSTSDGEHDVPTDVYVNIGGSNQTTQTSVENTDELNEPEVWESPDGEGEHFEAGSEVEIEAHFNHNPSSWWDPIGYWDKRVSSTENSDQLEVLRNGDQIPGWEGAQNQTSVAEFLEGYANDDGEITIGKSEAIYLYDGNEVTGDPADDPAVDFQDLVVLLSLSPAQEDKTHPTLIQYSENAMDMVYGMLREKNIKVTDRMDITWNYKTPHQSKPQY